MLLDGLEVVVPRQNANNHVVEARETREPPLVVNVCEEDGFVGTPEGEAEHRELSHLLILLEVAVDLCVGDDRLDVVSDLFEPVEVLLLVEEVGVDLLEQLGVEPGLLWVLPI